MISLDFALEQFTKQFSPRWYIEHLGESRTPMLRAGDVHKPRGHWTAKAQHYRGGREQKGKGVTPAIALAALYTVLYEYEAKEVANGTSLD